LVQGGLYAGQRDFDFLNFNQFSSGRRQALQISARAVAVKKEKEKCLG